MSTDVSSAISTKVTNADGKNLGAGNFISSVTPESVTLTNESGIMIRMGSNSSTIVDIDNAESAIKISS